MPSVPGQASSPCRAAEPRHPLSGPARSPSQVTGPLHTPPHGGVQQQHCQAGSETALCSGAAAGDTEDSTLALTVGKCCHQALHVVGTHHTAQSGPEAVVRGRMPSPYLSFLICKIGRLKSVPSEGCHEGWPASEHTARTKHLSHFESWAVSPPSDFKPYKSLKSPKH